MTGGSWPAFGNILDPCRNLHSKLNEWVQFQAPGRAGLAALESGAHPLRAVLSFKCLRIEFCRNLNEQRRILKQ